MEINVGPYCPKHSFLKTTTVCFDCPQHILCSECLQAEHKKHTIMSIDELTKNILLYNQGISAKKTTQLMMREIKRINDTIIQQIKQITDKVVKTSIKQIYWKDKQYQQVNGQISQLLQQNCLFTSTIKSKLSLTQAESTIRARLVRNLNQFRNCQKKLIEAFTTLKSALNQQKSSNFEFSLLLKHISLSVIEGNIIKKTNTFNEGHLHLALLNSPFTVNNNSVTFKINSLSEFKGLTIGVCIADKVRQSSYYKCWRLGQGTYGIYINQFGQIKSNHHNLKNYCNAHIKMTKQKSQMWKKAGKTEQIQKGDTITLEVNYFSEEIRFIRNKCLQAVVEIPVNLDQGHLYGFVGISRNGDQIEVV